MNLTDKINQDIKKAMLAKDAKRLEALRAIKSALLLAKTDKKNAGENLSETLEMAIIQRLVKQRKESARVYREQNREELAGVELYQSGVIEEYLPRQMSEEEIRNAITEIISQTGASTLKDMGKVMGMATKQLAGKADNKRISEEVRNLLA